MKKFVVGLLTFFTLISACNFSKNKTEINRTNEMCSEANWNGCMVSAYVFKENGRNLPQNFEKNINEFESPINHKIGSVMWYPTFADNFPATECKKLSDAGYIPHLTWEFFIPDSVDYNTMPINENYKLTDDVLSGKYDNYIKKFATDAKKFEGKVLIRFLHEFNGNWYLWSGNKNGGENGGPEKIIKVWRYVVDIFRKEGANNVKWIWNPHGPSIDVSTENWNSIENYWPGENYADWIGMDAYNWYPKDPWGGKRHFRDFDNCFKDLYDDCTKLSKKPVMIAEFATSEFNFEGKTKADWINDALTKIKTEYPRIKMFVWFQINKELDWRVNSSNASLNAFKTGVSDKYFIGKYTEK